MEGCLDDRQLRCAEAVDVQARPAWRLAAIANRAYAIAGSLGVWPNRLLTLEVPGLRTGRLLSFPVVVADHEGERYLVAMLGQNANWVRPYIVPG
jgi:hypothetical protein